jgi:drug/metabolite transporter (DMT)-like permease
MTDSYSKGSDAPKKAKFTPAIFICYLIVGILWGCTNPFIKHAQSKNSSSNAMLVSTIHDHPKLSSTSTTFGMIRKFFSDPLLFLPFLVNQSGSFFFYYIISSQPISVASPICNSLAFIFTAITGYFYFKEEVHSISVLILGVAFVLLGSYVCITS